MAKIKADCQLSEIIMRTLFLVLDKKQIEMLKKPKAEAPVPSRPVAGEATKEGS